MRSWKWSSRMSVLRRLPQLQAVWAAVGFGSVETFVGSYPTSGLVLSFCLESRVWCQDVVGFD